LRLFSFGGYGLAIAALAVVVLALMTATQKNAYLRKCHACFAHEDETGATGI